MATVGVSRMPDSPGSSPRLPSPPPMPEFQFGPQSPSVSASTNELQVDAPQKPDETAQRRIRPGTKAADMAKGPPLVPLIQLDSAFQLQEHLKSLYAQFTHGQSDVHTVPITRETAPQIATPPQLTDGESVDKNLWLYELCRFLTMKANLVSVALMADNPPCSSVTCPEMRASEWQYLCAVHEPPKSCCAIDYVNHTLDWAANVLTSTKHFPSRLQLGGETGNVFQSMRQLTNIFRRVYRIFAHAWFQHREVFWHIEATYGIYMLFKTVCDKYQLIPEDNYTVPPEAEGLRDEVDTPVNPDNNSGIHILRKDNDQQPQTQNGHDQSSADASTTVSTGATTRRHKHTPSTGSHVATIAEGTEEDDDPQAQGTQPSLSPLSTSSPPKPNKASPDRPTPQSLGRLDIANTVPSYVLSNPSDPTPTTATSDKDSLSATKAFKSPSDGKDNTASASATVQRASSSSPNKSSSPSKATSTSPQKSSASPQKPNEKQISPSRTGNVNVKPRRGSGFESEVRSPTGGSYRTAGPDILSAVLGHMSDEDDEDGDAGAEGEAHREDGDEDEREHHDPQQEAAEAQDNDADEGVRPEESAGSTVGAELKREDTTVLLEREESREKGDGERKDAHDDVKAAVEGDGSDEDDLETMEEIRLPERRSSSPLAAGDANSSDNDKKEAGKAE